MAEVVRMPKMSDTMTEGVLAKWHKKVGDKVKSGDLVAEIETDKATMEFESYQEGTILYIGIAEGQSVPVDGIIAILGAEGEEYKSLLTEAPAAPAAAPKAAEPAPKAPVTESSPKPAAAQPAPAPISTSVASGDSRLKASPLAKRLAAEKGIDIQQLQGSGDNGRIVKRDIDWYKPGMAVSQPAASYSTPAFVGTESYEEVNVSPMRKVIAKRLSESKFGAPHFYLTMEINMDKMMAAREELNSIAPVKISFNDLVIKAVAASLKLNPKANSSWLGDKIRYNHHINIGVAVAVEEGLLVPVVRYADGKSLTAIATEVKEFSQKAKDKKLQPADWEGNTFTISNLGMFGIEQFTAIINPPDACILAVGAIKQTPVVKDGAIAVGHVMKVTLSCDHRVVDGAVGSAFLKTLKGLLENPLLLLGQGNI